MEENSRQKAEELVEKLKELVKKGSVTKIQISRQGNVLVSFPVNVGVIAGVVVAPWALILGALVTLGTDCSVEIVKEDGQIVKVI